MISEHQYWETAPHQWGPGKVHALREDDASLTVCNRDINTLIGCPSDKKKATCKTCLKRLGEEPEPATRREHHCHARQCTTEVPPEKLMCFKHWSLVPKSLQQAVWRNYRPGQCNDKRPSREWLDAADAAINYVFRLEYGPTGKRSES